MGEKAESPHMLREAAPRSIDVQHDPRDLAPVGTFCVGIEHTEIRDHVLIVVGGERWTGGRQIGDVRIKW